MAELAQLPANKILHDREIKGFIARKLASGSVSLGYRYRADGREHWRSLGILGAEVTLDDARKQAKVEAGKVAAGGNPAAELAAKKAAVAADAEMVVGRLAQTFLAHYAKRVRPRTHYIAERMFARFIVPTFGKAQVGAIKRSDIVRLLDKVEGDAMSRQVLATFTNFFNWHARRADDFVSPIVRGMARGECKARDRVLADDEIADLWAALNAAPGRFADVLKLILLTGQRPGEVGAIEAHEIEGRVWRMPAEKNKIGIKHSVPLSPMAFAIVEPHIGKSGYIFSLSGNCPAPGDTRSMRAVRAAINERRKAAGRNAMPNWTQHDLRRTARTLMSRDKEIAYHIAERVIGHIIGSKVARTYDNYDYLAEKRDALERLAALVATITNPPSGGKVVPLRKSAAV